MTSADQSPAGPPAVAADKPPRHATVASLTGWQRSGLLLSLCIGVLAVAFEMYAINSTAPTIVPELNGMALYSWAFTMFALGQVFSIIVVGRLVDRFGAFKPLAVGVVFFMVGLALAGSAHHMFTFLAARAVQGLGGGVLNIALMVVVAEVYPGHQRSHMMTIFSFCYLLPAFVGPGVAAFIAALMGWRYVFWLIIPLMFAASVVGYIPVHHLYKGRAIRHSSSGQVPIWVPVVGILGLAVIQGVTQRISQSISQGTANGVNWSLVVLVVAGLVAVGVAMPRLMPAGFWRFRPGMASLMWIRLTLAGSFFASLSFLTLMLTKDRGLGPQQAGWALALGSLGWTLGMVLQSRSWLKVRRDQIIIIGSSITTIAVGLIAVFARWPQASLFLAIGAMLLAGFGMGLGVSSTSLALMTLSPADSIGHNTSSLQVADGLGSAFFAGVAGTIFAALHTTQGMQITFGWIYGVNAAVALLALVLAVTRLGRVRNESSGFG